MSLDIGYTNKRDRNRPHKDDWKTPRKIYDPLHREFKFTFDPCPFMHDTGKWDGLLVEWQISNFINPPYSQKPKEDFVKKAIEESKLGKVCVVLIPVSTSTKLFHEFILPNKKEIRYIRGRVKFTGINGKGQRSNYPKEVQTDELIRVDGKLIPLYVNHSGMHDSMLVIFDGRKKQ